MKKLEDGWGRFVRHDPSVGIVMMKPDRGSTHIPADINDPTSLTRIFDFFDVGRFAYRRWFSYTEA